jgi:hypothetical protein
MTKKAMLAKVLAALIGTESWLTGEQKKQKTELEKECRRMSKQAYFLKYRHILQA